MYLSFCLPMWAMLAQTPGVGAPATTPPHPGHGVLGYVLMVIYLLVCLGLTAAVLSQTSKNEGLGGTLGGGGSQSVFQGKKSVEEKLGTITNVLAVSFIVLSMVVSLVLR